MRLRKYLLLANTVSISTLLICLIISYFKMFLSIHQLFWLSVVTIGVGVISFVLNYIMTRPIERSIRMIAEETDKIAKGHFHVQVPLIGPLEVKQLATRFNEMSINLQQSFDKLRQSESSRKELVANVSHDLRTPLASIQSFVEALEDDLIQDEETFRRYLHTIRLETQRLGGMIDDLFELSRLESGMEAWNPISYHVEDLILEKLEGSALQLEEKKLEVQVDVPEQIPNILIMPYKMKRVLSNLLHNAIRYSPTAGILQIRVVKLNEDEVKIMISDQGEGLDESEKEHIFERFYRTDKSRNRESGGAGLGLAIAKSIVHIHGGRIGVESKKGEGSTFWFTLPIFKSNG